MIFQSICGVGYFLTRVNILEILLHFSEVNSSGKAGKIQNHIIWSYYVPGVPSPPAFLPPPVYQCTGMRLRILLNSILIGKGSIFFCRSPAMQAYLPVLHRGGGGCPWTCCGIPLPIKVMIIQTWYFVFQFVFFNLALTKAPSYNAKKISRFNSFQRRMHVSV